MTIIKHGSHFERERENEREVDIIDNEIVKEVLAADAGIVSPYRNQVTLLNDRLFEYGFAIDTIHKFQGNETIYISKRRSSKSRRHNFKGLVKIL